MRPDVPSIAVFCSESIECFPGTASKFFLKLLITIPVAPITTGIIVHFRFHIRCISTQKLLYFNLFSASFCTTFLSAGIATSISVHVFCFLFLIIISDLFTVTSLSVCTAWFHNTVIIIIIIIIIISHIYNCIHNSEYNYIIFVFKASPRNAMRKKMLQEMGCCHFMFVNNIVKTFCPTSRIRPVTARLAPKW